jgi:hypothetical protein
MQDAGWRMRVLTLECIDIHAERDSMRRLHSSRYAQCGHGSAVACGCGSAAVPVSPDEDAGQLLGFGVRGLGRRRKRCGAEMPRMAVHAACQASYGRRWETRS